MPTFRVVWEFVENQGSSWNEVFYCSATSALVAASVGSGLASKRLAFMHPLNRLVQIRSSQVDALRVTGNVQYNWFGTYTGTSGPATPGDAIVCTLVGSGGGNRRIWCRGAPDDYIMRSAESGLDAPPAALTTKLTSWFAALQTNGYGLYQVSTQAPGPLKNVKILSVDGTAKNGTSIVTLAQAPGYPFPSRVIIGGASKKDLPALNGRWSLVQAANLATIVIPYQTPQGLVVTGGNAQCRQEVYQAVNVISAASCGFNHYGTRSTKNPVTRSRGARRAVRIRTSL